jgi:hypothetical protein
MRHFLAVLKKCLYVYDNDIIYIIECAICLAIETNSISVGARKNEKKVC